MPGRFVPVISPTGEVGELPEEELQSALADGFQLAPVPQAPAAPQVAPPPAPKFVDVIAPTGERGQLPENEVQDALNDGFSLAPTPVVADEAQYGSFGQEVATSAEGLARGATLGLSDVAVPYLEGLGARIGEGLAGDQAPEGFAPSTIANPTDYTQEARDAMAGRRETNPYLAGASEFAGALAPALMTGGASLGARALAATPAGLLARGSLMAAEKIGGGAAASLGMKALGLLAAGSIEGAVSGAGETISQMALNDNYEGIAERIALGTVLGGLGSTILGGIVGGVSRLLGGSADDVAAKAAANIAGDIETKIDDVATKVESKGDEVLSDGASMAEQASVEEGLMDPAYMKQVGIKTDAEINGTLELTPAEPVRTWAQAKVAELKSIRTRDELVGKFQDLRDKLVKPMTAAIDELSRIKQNSLDRFINKSKKPQVLERLLNEEGTAWTTNQADATVSFLNEVDEIAKSFKDQKLSLNYSPQQQKRMTAVENAVEHAKTYLTGQKRAEIGPITPDSRILRIDTEAMANVIWALDTLKTYMGQQGKSSGNDLTLAVEDRLQTLYMQLRAQLQDPKFVGKGIAEMQRATNLAETKYIGAARPFRAVFGMTEDKLGENAGTHGFQKLIEADPERLKAFMDKAGRPENYKNEQIFLSGLERAQELLEVKSKWYGMPDEAKARIIEGRVLVEKLKEDFAKARMSNMMADKATKFAGNSKATGEAIQALGALASGVPFLGGGMRLVGSAASAVASPLMEAAAQGAVKAQSTIQKAGRLRGFLDPSATKKAPVVSARVAQQLGEWLSGDESKSPLPTQATVAAVAQEDPQLAMALQANADAQRAFLMEKMGPQPMDAAGRLRPYPMATLQRVAKYAQAVKDPLAVVERVGNGSATREDIEVLQRLYPSTWEDVLTRASDTLAGSKVTKQQRLRASYKLGVPFDDSLRPENVAFTQGIAQRGVTSPEAAQDQMRVADVATNAQQVGQ